MSAAQKEFFSIESLAAWLGVPPKTVRQWRYNGDAPRGIKVGRHVRFRRSDVEAWLEEHADDREPAA